MDAIKSVVSSRIRELIVTKQIDVTSPFALASKVMELLNIYSHLDGSKKRTLLVDVLTDLASGADHVVGTEDDLIPAKVVQHIRYMIESDLIADFATVVIKAVKSKIFGGASGGRCCGLF